MRNSILGENPRWRREQIRAGLPDGFYICISGKRSVRTLHLLGRCYLLQDVDYWRYSYEGHSISAQSLFRRRLHALCKKREWVSPLSSARPARRNSLRRLQETSCSDLGHTSGAGFGTVARICFEREAKNPTCTGQVRLSQSPWWCSFCVTRHGVS